MTRLAFVRFSLAATLLLSAASAHAQESSSEPVAEAVVRARAEYRAGVASAREQDWVEAEAAFQRAYALYPDPTIIFNLAGARAQLGRLIDARATYREFIDRSSDEHAEIRATAEVELASIQSRIGRIEMAIEGLEDADLVAVDGRAVNGRVVAEADPGVRVVTVQRGSAEVARAEVTVPEGEAVVAELTIVNPERVVVVERGGEDVGAIVAIVVSIALALGAAATITGVVLTQQAPQPHQGNVGQVTVPLAVW